MSATMYAQTPYINGAANNQRGDTSLEEDLVEADNNLTIAHSRIGDARIV
jgi:hypothetical protein